MSGLSGSGKKYFFTAICLLMSCGAVHSAPGTKKTAVLDCIDCTETVLPDGTEIQSRSIDPFLNIPRSLRSTPILEFAPPIEKRVTIQPVQICDDNGLNCANVNRTLYSAETNKIWAQAGIRIDFLPFVTYFNTAYSTNICFIPGSNISGNSDPNVITMSFSKKICDNSSIAGYAWIGSADMVIADATFSHNAVDVIAHELGHNLGLVHISSAVNLMSPSSIATSINNLYPDGSQLAKLTTGQISTALTSYLVLPIPASVAVTTAAVVDGQAYAFPNPSVSGVVKVRASLGLVDSVELTIVDMSGEVVHSAALSGTPSGNEAGNAYYEYQWSESVPSGIYTAVFNGKKSGGNVNAKARFAVIK